ncbi:pyrroloquinoline quinone biosynthesis protein B [Lentzea albidocapillata subsp. violacea]|uniref:Coenzyme PQQ synthesis protein B n=1 Tax=Lentzea albidocapillata subsp. violacea TaxID=128104 RepID=A0A1G9G8X8_9PSEU|nr:pyrroloquinoline quinone biosynthesis protein PqqB [Lentzea albidocapillata]SDK97031.1 pyrroloquinoline quinone biosynthesis protein B [Lentzea albidocapillata subsp. violacea]
MKAVLLGTTAGGGFPQWNCACPLCVRARSGELPSRSQDCLAISGNGTDWWLVNASSDIRTQIASCSLLNPGPGARETPLRGALFTDAELDHTLGLLTLRGGAGLTVWAPGSVLHALKDQFDLRTVIDGYAPVAWRQVDQPFDLGGLRVSAIPISGKRPKYARSSTMDGPWVVAYRFEDPVSGGVLVYAPCLASWPAGFDEVVAGADCLLLDGTFYAASEMGSATGSSSGQAAMGHLPITASLPELRRFPGVRRIYTHLNNTNPVLDPSSPESAKLREAGVEVPLDGTVIEL